MNSQIERSKLITLPSLESDPQPSLRARFIDLGVWLALIVSTFAVYAQVGGFEFSV